MALGTPSTCLNHPGYEAVGRCKQCGKPFCSKCRVQAATGNFCSEPCMEKHEKFSERVQQMERVPQGRSILGRAWRFGRRLVFYAAVLVVVAAILAYLGLNIPIISPLLQQILGG